MRIELEYHADRQITPLTAYVHLAPKGGSWWQTPAHALTPPMPSAVVGRGFPLWRVSYRGRSLSFASYEEIAHAVEVLERKVLPSPRVLGAYYGHVNRHWLSRLHKVWTPFAVRQRLTAQLKKVLAQRR